MSEANNNQEQDICEPGEAAAEGLIPTWALGATAFIAGFMLLQIQNYVA